MSVRCAINFSELEHLTPYTLRINGNSAQFGSSSNFEIEYSGADLIQKQGYIPEKVLPLLKNELNDLIGYGPFDKRMVNKKFKLIQKLMYSIDGDKVTRI